MLIDVFFRLFGLVRLTLGSGCSGSCCLKASAIVKQYRHAGQTGGGRLLLCVLEGIPCAVKLNRCSLHLNDEALAAGSGIFAQCRERRGVFAVAQTGFNARQYGL